jgi:hypothetical protein
LSADEIAAIGDSAAHYLDNAARFQENLQAVE